MFIGRERELSEFDALYRQDRFQLFVLYGRRRVGKTTFLRSIAYLLASGNYPQPRRVGIADERCELFLPDKMGALIDCVRDMPKAAGIELLTRSMSPEVRPHHADDSAA